jgi:hypothetical protein
MTAAEPAEDPAPQRRPGEAALFESEVGSNRRASLAVPMIDGYRLADMRLHVPLEAL